MRLALLLGLTLGVLGCQSYDYEEEVFLRADGSGRIRVSGSADLLKWFDGVDPATMEGMRARFDDPRLEIDAIYETKREGERFLHVEGHFADWNALCQHPVFGNRQCRLEPDGADELELRSSVRAPPLEDPDAVRPSPDARLAFRFHFPSKVRFHNSPGGIERGNIIRWECSAAELLGGGRLDAEARFERRSVLASTLVVLGVAFALVIGAVSACLFWMVRKGRRQLLRDGETGGAAAGRRTDQL